MTNKIKASTPFVDFNPAFDLKKEDGLESLIIHLPGFKKEQLKVQVHNNGDLKVSGERPTSSGSKGSKRSRFIKEIKVAEDCDISGIRAKFINGRLHVIMPPKKPVKPDSSPLIPASDDVNDRHKRNNAEDRASDDKNANETITGNGKLLQTSSCSKYDQKKSIIQMLQGRKRVILGFGIAVAVVVACNWYFVSSMYGSNTTTAAPCLYMDD